MNQLPAPDSPAPAKENSDTATDAVALHPMVRHRQMAQKIVDGSPAYGIALTMFMTGHPDVR
jgi:hypothetical protein